MLKRHLWWMTGVVGVIAFTAGLLYDASFAGIPYQDPSPELQQNYDFHSSIARIGYCAGGALIAGGFVLGIFARKARSRETGRRAQ